MCRSEKGQRIIREVDPSRMLTETDGPFVTTNDRPAIPDDVSRVVAMLGEVWGCDAAEANQRVLQTWTEVIV
jgi:TatD DNase family protein